VKKMPASVQDSEGLLGLLESIVATYHDADSRPAESLVLYRQCLQLRKNYQVHLTKRFLVVEGGARYKRTAARPRATQGRAQARLKLAPKLELTEELQPSLNK